MEVHCVLRKCNRRKFFRVCPARCMLHKTFVTERRRKVYLSLSILLSPFLPFVLPPLQHWENAVAPDRYFLVAVRTTVEVLERPRRDRRILFSIWFVDAGSSRKCRLQTRCRGRIKSFSHDGSEVWADVGKITPRA